mmetsp:Transcript_80714/g.231873  ORF Transcript_80714/g.231873 Transcript_80714/m.231873 type:complete len:87 (+) Transcript_80714:545-805(+)
MTLLCRETLDVAAAAVAVAPAVLEAAPTNAVASVPELPCSGAIDMERVAADGAQASMLCAAGGEATERGARAASAAVAASRCALND